MPPTRNYHGSNYIAFIIWNLEAGGINVGNIELSVNGTIMSGFGSIPMAPMSQWSEREDAY